MMKKTITITKVEVVTDGNGRIVSQTVEKTVNQEEIAKYLVPLTNFYTDDDPIMLYGIPCKVVGDPFIKDIWTWDYRMNRKVKVAKTMIPVLSCVTGRRYHLPADTPWIREFDNINDANRAAKINGIPHPEVINKNLFTIIGKPYWPMDNSGITRMSDPLGYNTYLLMGKQCTVFSEPYEMKCPGDKDKTYIQVLYQSEIYQVPFYEWCLVKPEKP